MAIRQFTNHELLVLAYPLLKNVRARLQKLSGGDDELLWALRRKLYKELVYDERSKPTHRTTLKRRKRREQDNICAECGDELPEEGSVLDRIEAMSGYTEANTRLLCPKCDRKIQKERGYK